MKKLKYNDIKHLIATKEEREARYENKKRFVVMYNIPHGKLNTATVKAVDWKQAERIAKRIISWEASCKPKEITFWGSVEEEWIIN